MIHGQIKAPDVNRNYNFLVQTEIYKKYENLKFH